jgi:hypothetical protein
VALRVNDRTLSIIDAKGQPDLPCPEHAIVRGMDSDDLGSQLLVPQLARGGRAGAVLVVGRGAILQPAKVSC